MLRHALVIPLAAALALPARAEDPEPPVEGRLEAGAAQVEILGRPVRVGERIELPEGYLIVEEKGTEDARVGSFSVVPAESFQPVAMLAMAAGDGAGRGTASDAAPAPAPAAPAVLPAGQRPEPPCRGERAAYLRELWKTSGIDVRDPDALLTGLEAGAAGPATGYYWFALATDPFRPLAWSSDLRERADALARCVRGR
ncbi:conserved hypothetical protein [Anaeromyxobacter dehalogenans 2CP-1]|uniref:Uncharacterized protein n=1 Tax=Anaeromyxobacter dehalogenans (strain ATCC BAA-258 / DSM 21875 / 2CP-1) TaxID=455488 RepID=B8JBI3_ANAD2|nr:hypothetical protein [Anaeromyxobacter dehalogenans]ACL67591.1 conserved hypothetical protein [Anaeromyxobacter dehalogenans 2CP-1]